MIALMVFGDCGRKSRILRAGSKKEDEVERETGGSSKLLVEVTKEEMEEVPQRM